MAELLEDIGHKIRQLREEKGWNQTELGFRAGSSPSIISLIENGKRNPSTATLARIAEALGVEVVDLFPKASGRSSDQPTLLNGLEDERRRFRVQLVRELKDHVVFLTERYRSELARLMAREGTLADWKQLERESAFTGMGASYLLQDESGAPEGLQSEAERRAWRAAYEATQALDALCNEIEAAAHAAREAEGQEEDEGIRALEALRRRAG